MANDEMTHEKLNGETDKPINGEVSQVQVVADSADEGFVEESVPSTAIEAMTAEETVVSRTEEELEYHRISVYYAEEIEKCPPFGEALKRYVEMLQAQRNVRALCKEDSPEALKEMIGQEVDGFTITEETYQNAKMIHDAYTMCYEECKHFMKALSEGKYDPPREPGDVADDEAPDLWDLLDNTDESEDVKEDNTGKETT